MSIITDLWFRSPLELEELAAALELSHLEFDAENYWEWAIGTLDEIELDITRTHLRPPATVDTRIYRVDQQPLSDTLRARLVERLAPVAHGRISWGRAVWPPTGSGGEEPELQEAGHSGGEQAPRA